MAISVTHTFVSPVADDGDPNEVGPNEWNAAHTISGLGTAAEADSTDFATAAQGSKADTALQSVVQGSGITVDNTDPLNPVINATGGGSGDMTAAVYDPQNIADDAFDRANHTGTQTAATISDFDTEVANNTDVAANTAARHAAVTVTDSAEINFTLVGQDITASLVAASIDESKLDASVNASLDLADSAVQPAAVREKLTTGLSLYVRTDGSDSNNGRADSAGGAVLTIQKAVDLAKAVDSNGFDVTINVRAGTRTVGAVVDGPLVGGGALNIIGDVTTPANCVINTTSADCFFYTNNARGTVRGFQMTTTTSGSCLKAYLGAYLVYGSVIFGSCAGMHVDAGTEAKVIAAYNYTISGGAVGHLHTGSACSLLVQAITITLTGTPAFGAYFAGTAGGYQAISASVVFSGSATGKRFLAHKNGVIDVGTTSTTVLPGDVAGTYESGGKYCGDVTYPDIIGDLGATDNALIRADGTGGVNAQGSSATLSDNAVLSLSTTTQFNPQVVVDAEYNGTSAGYINFQKGRASGAVSNGDDVGTFVGQARDSGGVLRNVGYFAFSVAAAPAAGSVDGKILFNTTQSAVAATRVTIGQGILLAAATGGDKGSGTLNASSLYVQGVLISPPGAPVTKTADFTVAATEQYLINNKSGSSCTVTLPTASSFPGRKLTIKTIQAQTTVSASSNVVPLGGGAAGTAILSANAGRWAELVSNGTNWEIMTGVV